MSRPRHELLTPAVLLLAILGAGCRAVDPPTVSATAAAAASPAAGTGGTADKASLPDWTFLIYAAIDNNAEEDSNFFAFLDGVRAEHRDDPRVEIILFADRSEGYSDNSRSLGEDFSDTRIYRVRSGKSERLGGGAEFPEITTTSRYEADSADPENLRKFLAYAKAHHPARHVALMLYGHADGRAMCPDEQSGHEMGFAQVTDVVPESLSVDLMALELCFMGGIEVAYQWRPGNGGFSTRYLVAIPNAGPALDWHRVFTRLRGDAALEPAALGAMIVAEGGAGRLAMTERRPDRAGMVAHEAVSCYDLARAAEVKRAVDGLAAQLARGDGDTRQAFVRDVRGPGASGPVLNYSRDHLQEDPFVDLHDLALRAAAADALGPEVRRAALGVADAVDGLVVASWGGPGLPRFKPGASGVYITFPAGEPAAWKRCRWYTPLPQSGVYGRLAWCRDGSVPDDGIVQTWYELLDAWLDVPPAQGAGNGYSY